MAQNREAQTQLLLTQERQSHAILMEPLKHQGQTRCMPAEVININSKPMHACLLLFLQRPYERDRDQLINQNLTKPTLLSQR